MLDSDPRIRLVYLEDPGKDSSHSLSASEQRLRDKYIWYPSGVSPDIVSYSGLISVDMNAFILL